MSGGRIEGLTENEPIDWLFGRVLQSLATRGESHYLSRLLAGENPHALEQWTSWVSEFRSLLTNPDVAAKKADEELCNNPPERIGDFMAEVFAVIHLGRKGYTDFEAVLAGASRQKAAVDFVARKEGKRVRIEVKRLRYPEDVIESVITARWRECCRKHPDKFSFRLSVRHDHRGSLSDVAAARLRNAIDQLPDFADDEYRLKLGDDIEVVLTRVRNENGDTTLAVQSNLGFSDFDFNLPELQNLYVKTFRVIGESLAKFFGRQAETDTVNLMAVQWEPPNFMYDAATPAAVQRAIEQAFSTVGLQLSVCIFSSPPEHKLRKG